MEMKEIEKTEEEGDFVVEIVDERDPEDQVDLLDDSAEDDDAEPTEEELQALSQRVQKRIGKLTFKYNDQRRKAEAAQRMQEEAIKFAEMTRAENLQMRKVLAEGENVVLSEVRARVKSDVENAHRAHIAAIEEGDPQKIADTQKMLNRAQIEEHQAETYRPQITQAPPETVRQQQVTPVVDERFESWRSKNDWWDDNKMLRAAATELHNQLAANQNSTGVTVGSDEYYNQIDSAMKPLVASFKSNPGSKGESVPVSTPAPSVVAPTSRNAATKSPRTVTLTDTAAKLANRLKIPLELYAAEKRKLDLLEAQNNER